MGAAIGAKITESILIKKYGKLQMNKSKNGSGFGRQMILGN